VFVVGCSSKEPTTKKADEEHKTPVEVMKISKGSIIKADTYTGQIQPTQQVAINSKTPGEVAKVNFDMGDQVSKGDILFVMDKTDIQSQVESLQSQLESSIVSFDSAKENFENMKILYDQGAISQQQFDQMRISYEQAKASKNSFEINLKNAKETLEDLEVRSPIAGVVAERNIQPGEMLGIGSPPFTILSMDTVYIDVSVPETLINRIQSKKEVEVRVEAVKEKPFKGTELLIR